MLVIFIIYIKTFGKIVACEADHRPSEYITIGEKADKFTMCWLFLHTFSKALKQEVGSVQVEMEGNISLLVVDKQLTKVQ